MPEITIVDFYCRTATLSVLNDTDLEEQEKICREYCDTHGLTLGMVNCDPLSVLQFRERLALNRMRKRYLDGTIQGVVVINPDSLSRSTVRQAILLSEMEQHNIALHVVDGRLEETPHGKFLLALSAFLIEVERERI